MRDDGIELSALSDPLPTVRLLEGQELDQFRASVDAYAHTLLKAGVQFGNPPFVLPDHLTPESVAGALTYTFYKMGQTSGPLLSLTWRLISAFAQPIQDLKEIREAGEQIAIAFDQGVGDNPHNSYHTAQHAFETMMCAHTLALLERRLDHALFPEARLLLMLSALIQQWHHPGTRNMDEHFQIEKHILTMSDPYLKNLTPVQRSQLELILLGSDISGPHNFTRALSQWYRSEKKGPAPILPAGMEAIEKLSDPEHALTVNLASMLCDAEALPLFGLTTDYAALKSRALQDEWARPIGQKDFIAQMHHVLGRARRPSDVRAPLSFEKQGFYIGFHSIPGQFFNPNLVDIVLGHAELLKEMGEDTQETASADGITNSIDLSVFSEVKEEATALGKAAEKSESTITDESILALKDTLEQSGYFDDPPFTMKTRSLEKIMPGISSEFASRLTLVEQCVETIIRLHNVTGPLISAVTTYLLEAITIDPEHAVAQAAINIAKQIDEGVGSGTLDDLPHNDRNPYHNRHHILDLVLITDFLGIRATSRKATASSPLARGLILLGALICHWHHTGKGNRVDGEYKIFHLQNRALLAAEPFLQDLSKELRQSLEIIVRTTDARDPYAFSRQAYSYHVGLGSRPDVPAGCESLVRLLGDPALCTLCTRLNDAIYVPFVGLGNAYSARSLVQLGRETGLAIDFNFVRQNLIAPLLSRPLYRGEQPPTAIRLGRTHVASFTSAEAQALFNPTLHALLLHQNKHQTIT